MTWWLIPSIIGVIVAGIIIGVLVSYFIVKKRKSHVPISEKPRQKLQNTIQTPIVQRNQESIGSFPTYKNPGHTAKKKRSTQVSQEQKTSNIHTSAPPQPVVPPGPAISAIKLNPTNNKISEPLAELEKNFAISVNPSLDKLVNYQTEIWNNRRTEFNSLSQDILTELTEAYVDMLLANNVVWLVTELGRNSDDLTSSYLRLSNKIAERLERIMPAVRTGLV